MPSHSSLTCSASCASSFVCRVCFMDDVLGWLDEVSGSGPSSAGAAASQPSVEAPSAQPSVLCRPTSVTQATTAASSSRQAPAPPPSYPVAFGSRHPEKESDHYVHNTIDLYASDITEPLKKIREIRGPLLEELTMASGCTGTGPESLLPAITALDVRHEFTCDLKSSAWLFIKSNCNIGDKCHHYLDLNALLADARCVDATGNEVDPSSPLKVGTHISGRCARHEMDVCGHFIAKTALDSFCCRDLLQTLLARPYGQEKWNQGSRRRESSRNFRVDHGDAGACLRDVGKCLGVLPSGIQIVKAIPADALDVVCRKVRAAVLASRGHHAGHDVHAFHSKARLRHFLQHRAWWPRSSS